MERADPPPASETVRQRLTRWLSGSERSFEELRRAFDLPARALEEELRHVERSARRQGRRLRVKGPVCLECGFDFPGRVRKHLHAPARCPECRGHRIESPRFHLRG